VKGSPDPLSPDRWQLIQDVLADAIDCPAPQRGALLDLRCAGDVSLRDEVESLLVAHEREGVVDHLAPLLKHATAWARQSVTDWSGRRHAQYLVREPVGSGATAVVYRARDDRLGRQVALKFLSPQLCADPASKTRFLVEARTAAALDHPNVCTIYEIGETEEGQLFIAMPLYDGETLQARLKRGRCSFSEALPIALQVARGLEHAHTSGIVHRDVKPSNIMILPDGTAKIVDFGIALMHDAALTDPQMLIGTVPYMSPEQASGGPIDCRSDIWSFGIVLHEALAGTRPFEGDHSPAVLEAIRGRVPQLVATSYPDVPAGIDRILRRALAKAPDERYPSMSLMAADLSALAAEATSDHERAEMDAGAPMSATQRRRAAVLATVVSDYPSLVDQMTPTAAHRLIARIRDAAVDVVREFGGLVNQAIGDEIVSVFGVPVAHEDDELRAVRAAIELRARVRAMERSDCPADVRLRVQSGLHVGAVVARRLHEGPRRFDIVGAPAAMASRLAALAEPDDVLIGPETRRLVSPYVHTETCSPVVLDSQAGPVTPYRVLGETGVATGLEASGTGLTPYVGRQAELSTLQSCVARAGSGRGTVVAVVGEAGAGKSRLLYELFERLRAEGGVRVLHARCRAYGDRVPYGVFVQILCAALDLRPPLTSVEAAARIRSLDATLEPFLPLYLHLLSVSSDVHEVPRHLRGEHLHAALLDALAALVGVLTRRGRLIAVIEDWHWADAGSRAALIRMAELTGSSPLVLIVTSRVEPGEHNGWPADAVLVRLDRLDFTASTAIVRAVLGVREVPDALAHRLDDRAGGNPFFLEQICTALIEQHAVTVRDGSAIVEGGEGGLVLPDTVQGVIRARLDGLDSHALEMVRVASVIGWEFDHSLLAEVVPVHVDLHPAIDALESAGLIQHTSGAPTISYRFTHALTQEVCYDSLVGHQRRRLHGEVGRALVSAHVDGMDERAALLAHHFGQAEDWPAAIRFGRRAAERAIALSQFADALATLDQLLDWASRLPGSQTDLIADLLLSQERVCETLGLRARQQQIIDSLIAELTREDRSARLAEVYLRQGDLSTLLKRFDAADRALATALRIGHERGDTSVVRSALRSLGLLRWHEGRHPEALEFTQRALDVDRESGDEVAVAVDLTNLGSILKANGDYPRARARLEEALAMPALRNDPKKLLYAQHNLANVYREMGDLDRALEYLIQDDEIARVHLLPIQRSFHLTSIAHIQLQQGRIESAVETYRTAVDLSRRARHAEGLVQSLRMLGNVLLGLGRYEEALPCVQEAAELFAQLEDRVSEAEMRSSSARILERTSPADAAHTWTVALTLQRMWGDSRGELEAREGLARAVRARGPEEAIPAFESALALAATIGETERELAIRNTLGILEWERGRYAAALKHYDSALALVRVLGHRGHEAVILNSLGASLTRLGRPEEARTVLEESLVLSREIGERQLEAHALAALGQIALNARDLNAAADWFEQSRITRHAIGDHAGEGWMHLRLAEIHNRIGNSAAALDSARAAAEAAAAAGDTALANSVRDRGTQVH
jgi:class 3 adenylate cyclase/tetratricopeptide (TPR) repeat protein/tRNA A-37 threonylcarbamoyl transferase component Bud32